VAAFEIDGPARVDLAGVGSLQPIADGFEHCFAVLRLVEDAPGHLGYEFLPVQFVGRASDVFHDL
jgi:hypothetical protein